MSEKHPPAPTLAYYSRMTSIIACNVTLFPFAFSFLKKTRGLIERHELDSWTPERHGPLHSEKHGSKVGVWKHFICGQSPDLLAGKLLYGATPFPVDPADPVPEGHGLPHHTSPWTFCSVVVIGSDNGKTSDEIKRATLSPWSQHRLSLKRERAAGIGPPKTLIRSKIFNRHVCRHTRYAAAFHVRPDCFRVCSLRPRQKTSWRISGRPRRKLRDAG